MKGCVLFKLVLFAALPANICAKYIDIIRKRAVNFFIKRFANVLKFVLFNCAACGHYHQRQRVAILAERRLHIWKMIQGKSVSLIKCNSALCGFRFGQLRLKAKSLVLVLQNLCQNFCSRSLPAKLSANGKMLAVGKILKSPKAYKGVRLQFVFGVFYAPHFIFRQ